MVAVMDLAAFPWPDPLMCRPHTVTHQSSLKIEIIANGERSAHSTSTFLRVSVSHFTLSSLKPPLSISLFLFLKKKTWQNLPIKHLSEPLSLSLNLPIWPIDYYSLQKASSPVHAPNTSIQWLLSPSSPLFFSLSASSHPSPLYLHSV